MERYRDTGRPLCPLSVNSSHSVMRELRVNAIANLLGVYPSKPNEADKRGIKYAQYYIIT